MSATNSRAREAGIRDVQYRVFIPDPLTGKAIGLDINCEIDLWSGSIVGYSVARAGDRRLVIRMLRTYCDSAGNCSEDMLSWASDVLGCSQRTIVRWLGYGPPPAPANRNGTKGTR